jgi:hypothetical protein
MKAHKIKKFRVKNGFVLAAIIKEGEKECEIYDDRKYIIMLNGQDIKSLVNLFRELKNRKFQTGINYHVLDRILRDTKRSNVNAKPHAKRASCTPPCKCNGERQGSNIKANL